MIKKGDRIVFCGKPARVTGVRNENGTTHVEGFLMETWSTPKMVEPTRIIKDILRGTISFDAHFTWIAYELTTPMFDLGDREVRVTETRTLFGT